MCHIQLLPTLFALAMNMLVKAAEVECRGPLSPVTATSVTGCRWLLQGLERLMTWARMAFKPAKSRSLVLRKGRVEDKYRFHLDGALIPSVSERAWGRSLMPP